MTAPLPQDTPEGFAALGLDAKLLAGLTALGYEEPTSIQATAIPPLLAGKDVRGTAATGTGKTAAFALPLLQRLEPGKRARGRVAAVVLVPTRELAIQVAEAIHRYGAPLHVSVLPIYGGQSMPLQLRALERGVDVVVATPGRALDHLRRKTLDLGGVRTVVLDEADEMLDMGFADDLEAILASTPPERQTALFSATMPPRILAIAKRHLKKPVDVSVEQKKTEAGALPQVRQTAYIVGRGQKLAALARVLDMEDPTSVMVFCRTRIEVDELTERLGGHGFSATALHGGMTQEQRDRVMKKFRSGKAEVLVATDVAARGLDIEHVSHVVNFDVPSAPEAYVHRIGRTGRAGRAGVAITLAEPREHRQLRSIEQLTKQKIEVAAVPTVADLRAKRLELLSSQVKEVLAAGDLDRYRQVASSLAEESDVLDIAAAALRVAHLAAGAESEGADIPPPPPPRPPRFGPRQEGGGFDRRAPFQRGGFDQRGGPDRERGPRGNFGAPAGFGAPGGGDPHRLQRPQRRESLQPGGREGVSSSRAGDLRDGGGQAVKIRLGCGKSDGIRPGDLVGAIANEADVDSSVIGAIEIAQHYSVVEIASDVVERVITALGKSKIKGKRVGVKRDEPAKREEPKAK